MFNLKLQENKYRVS